MSDEKPLQQNSTILRAKHFDATCDDFELQFLAGNRPSIESYLERVGGPEKQPLLVELIAIELHYRRKNGESIAFSEYQTRFPGLSALRLEETIQRSEKANSPKPPTADDATIDSRQVLSERRESELVKYFGDYELLDVIARGGMGIVYKARQVSLNRIVALKMILAGEFATKEEVERFYSEAKAAALLDHPGIVPIYEVGEHEGKHFFSMTYVEGSSLASKLNEGPLEPMQAASAMLEVSRAVHYAHEQGVIHRDLKPSNILLDLQGRPRVTDFGLAKRLSEDTGMTVSGQVLGTPSYMPPEQAAGQINTIGPCSDVYALGAVLYSLTTGRPPFQSASSVDTLRQVVEKEPVPPRQLNPAIPRDLETIILKCLEKSVPRRYGTAKLLSDELQRFVEGRPIIARPIGRAAKAWRWCRRQPVVASLLAAIFLSLLAGFGVSSYFAYSENIASANEKKEREEAQRQTGIARAETKKAEQSRQSEEAAKNLAQAAELREQAKSRELARTLYNSDLNRIEDFSRSGNMERIDALLRRHAPKSPEDEDLRGMEWYYWWKYAHEEQAQWKLPATVERLTLSSDGKTLVAACEGGKAYLWDASTQQRLPQVLSIDDTHWSAVQFVSNEPRVMGVGWKGRVREWDLQTEEITLDRDPLFETKEREAYGRWPASISSDGKSLVGLANKASLQSGIGLIALPEDSSPPRWMPEVSSGVMYLLLGGESSTVRLVGKFFSYLRQSNGTVSALSESGKIKGFANEHDPVAPPEEEWGISTFGLAFSQDGKLVAGGNREGQVAIYDVASGRLLKEFAAHSAIVWCVAISPDSRWMATGDTKGHIYVWDIATQRQLRKCEGHNGAVRALTFLGNNRLASAGDDTHVRIWELATAETPQVLRGHTARVNTLIANKDGNLLYSAGADHMAREWNVGSKPNDGFQVERTGTVNNMAVSADESRLLVDLAEELHLFDLTKESYLGSLQKSAELRQSKLLQIGLSPDGRYAIAWSTKDLQLWETQSRRSLSELNFHEDPPFPLLSTLTWSPDGKQIATGFFASPNIRIFSTPDLVCTKRITLDAGGAHDITFSPDGLRIASANIPKNKGPGKHIQVFSVEDAQELLSYRDPTGQIESFQKIAWSPDGKYIATSSKKGNSNDGNSSVLVRVFNADSFDISVDVFSSTAKESIKSCKGLLFSDDSKQLLVSTNSKPAMTYVWDASEKRVVKTWMQSEVNDHSNVFTRFQGSIFLTKNPARIITQVDENEPLNRTLRILHAETNTVSGALSISGPTVYGVQMSSVADTVEIVSEREAGSGLQTLAWSLYSLSGKPLATPFDLQSGTKAKLDTSSGFRQLSPHGLAGMQPDLFDWEMLKKKFSKEVEQWSDAPSQIGKTGFVHCLSYAPDRQRLVTVLGEDRRAIIWENIGKDNAFRYVPIHCFKLDARWVAIAPNASSFVAAVHNEIRLFDLSGESDVLLGSHAKDVLRVAWGNKGQWVAASDEGGCVTVWDVQQRKPVSTMRNHIGPVYAISFTNDGRTLFSAGEGEQILGCDPLSGEIKLRLSGHHGSVRDLFFDEKKQLLVSAGSNGIVRFWHSANRQTANSILNTAEIGIPSEERMITRVRPTSDEARAERDSAIALLKKGCVLTVQVNGSEIELSALEIGDGSDSASIPQGSFRIVTIKQIASRTASLVTDDDIALTRHMPLLASLHLEGQALTNKSLTYLRDHPFLRTLIFRDTDIQEIDLRILEASTVLEQIDFGESKIVPESISACQRMPRLQSLQLNGSEVQDHHLVALSGLTELQYLSLAANSITSTGIQHLATLNKLRFLDLSKTKIDDQAITSLTELPRLDRIDLTDTNITMDGVLELFAKKPYFTNLRVAISDDLKTDRWQDRAMLYGLDLEMGLTGIRKIGDKGYSLTRYQFPRDPFCKFSPMRCELSESESFAPRRALSGMNDRDLQMFDHLDNLRELEILVPITDPQIEQILQGKSLRQLQLRYFPIGEVALAAATHQTSLQSLAISLEGLSDATTELLRLRELPNLVSLELYGGEVDPVSITNACPKLQSLQLQKVKLLGEGLQKLASLRQLAKLELELKEPYSLAQIASWFPALRHLSVDDPRINDNELAFAVEQLIQLETLEFTNAQFTNESIQHFAKMKSLKNLELSNTGLDSKAESRIKKLLPNCKIRIRNR